MNNEKHKVTWDLPKHIHDRLEKLAKAKGRRTSTQNLGIVFLERGVEDEERANDSNTINRELAELKGVEIISGCITIVHLKSAINYVDLFEMAFGSSQILNNAYEAKKLLIIN